MARIHQPCAGIALWSRPCFPALRAAAERLCTALAGASSEATGGGLRAPLAGADPADAITDLLCGVGLTPAFLVSVAPLLQDLDALARRFVDLAKDLPAPTPIGLRLEVIAATGCPRFHVDHSQLRLLCTYQGPGTEWLHADQVDRAALYDHQPNERILRAGRPACLATGAVAVFKGERYPGQRGRGLVHRSPPATGRMRLLYCLDV